LTDVGPLSGHTALECEHSNVPMAQPVILPIQYFEGGALFIVGVSPKDGETVGTAQVTCGLSARVVSG